MSIEERQFIDKIEIIEDGSIFAREVHIVMKDGVELARNFNRSCFAPGSEITIQDKRLSDVAAIVWSKEVVDAYSAEEAARIEAMRLEVEKIQQASEQGEMK